MSEIDNGAESSHRIPILAGQEMGNEGRPPNTSLNLIATLSMRFNLYPTLDKTYNVAESDHHV